jgi:hypothetical protein
MKINDVNDKIKITKKDGSIKNQSDKIIITLIFDRLLNHFNF